MTRLALAAITVLTCITTWLPASAQTTLRVLLLRHQLQTVVASAGGLVVRPFQAGAQPLLTPDVTTVIDVRPQAGGLLLAGTIQTMDKLLISPLTGATVTVDGESYRGSVLIERDAEGGISVIDVVELEDYLYSVVGSEVAASTPASALQAQAVVARTYAVAHLGAHEDLGFDLRAGDQDQAYNGIAAESAPVVNAVDATRGVVMLYGDHLASAYYSACDGGYTSDGRALNDPQPYLQAVRDPYCPMSPYMQWSASVPLTDLIAGLAARGAIAQGVAASEVRGVRPGPVDASGRLQTVVLGLRGGDVSVAGTAFRFAAGARLVKSTRITALHLDGDLVRVSGEGYGHGVGMCQLGARGMSEAGLGVYAILDFYYPGAILTQLASYERRSRAFAQPLRIAARR
ncbi:MAG: SpoIID/LytB domain-containing protein [Candidatus Eremiobacteraeota bacterium]|nr:SpoIID/LytB domain-containing protein [Candidatus Eremiobacteraeota bacterium]